MIDYNLILFVGCGLIIFGFALFLYSEMKERELDIKLFELEQKIKEEKNDQYIIFSWNLCNWNFSLFRNERNRGNMTRTETIMIICFVIYLFAMFWIGGIR